MKAPVSSSEFGYLVDAARKGSASDLGRLLLAYEPILLAVARADIDIDLIPKESGSDLVQATLLEAIKDFDRFKTNKPEEFLAWLLQLLGNNIRDLNRKYRGTEKRSLSLEVHLDSSGVFALLAKMATEKTKLEDTATPAMIRLKAVLATLPLEEQTLIAWRYGRQMSYVQMGAKLEKSPDAIRKACNRILAKLISRMGDQNGPA